MLSSPALAQNGKLARVIKTLASGHRAQEPFRYMLVMQPVEHIPSAARRSHSQQTGPNLPSHARANERLGQRISFPIGTLVKNSGGHAVSQNLSPEDGEGRQRRLR